VTLGKIDALVLEVMAFETYFPITVRGIDHLSNSLSELF